MPMDFPDMRSLVEAARIHHFRMPQFTESEADYREALADHVVPIDFVESVEIRNKVGHDLLTLEQMADALRRRSTP